MRIRGSHAAVTLVVLMVLAACGGAGNADKAKMQKAAAEMTQQRDSTINVMDSTKGATTQVDTTKLGAAKTESILTKTRKKP